VRNHYVTLELMQDAGDREIVYAYRHLARRLHPDLHPEDPDAAERFRVVQEAYDVLRDPAARSRHDADLARVGVVPPGGVPAPRSSQRTRPGPAPRPRTARSAAPTPRIAPRPRLRRPWWEPPVYGIVAFAAASLVAIAAAGWRTYEHVGGDIAAAIFLASGIYVLYALWSDATTRR
jgi:curved DNA-binding protein CbpA